MKIVYEDLRVLPKIRVGSVVINCGFAGIVVEYQIPSLDGNPMSQFALIDLGTGEPKYGLSFDTLKELQSHFHDYEAFDNDHVQLNLFRK